MMLMGDEDCGCNASGRCGDCSGTQHVQGTRRVSAVRNTNTRGKFDEEAVTKCDSLVTCIYQCP